MFLMSKPQIDFIVARRRAIMVVGLVLMAVPLVLGFGFGALSGFMLFSLGIFCVFFRNWRSEPGVWMLAILLVLTLGPCFAYFEYFQLIAIFAPPGNLAWRAMGWNQIRMSLDASVALLIFAKTMKLVVTVAIENWKRTRTERPRYRA